MKNPVVPVKNLKKCPGCGHVLDIDTYFGYRSDGKRTMPQSYCVACRKVGRLKPKHFMTLNVGENLTHIVPAVIGTTEKEAIFTFGDGTEIRVGLSVYKKFEASLKKGRWYSMNKLTRAQQLAVLKNLLPKLYYHGYFVGDFSEIEMRRMLGETERQVLKHSMRK